MTAIVVYGPRRNPFVDKVLRALALKKLDHRLLEPAGPEDYRRWNPETGLLPVADLAGGRVADSHRILDVLDERWPEPPLLASDPKVAAAQRRLEAWASQTFVFYWERYQRQRVQELEGAAEERAQGALARFGILRRAAPVSAGERYASEFSQRIGDLANFLGTRPFFHADRIGRADLAVYSFLGHETIGSLRESAEALEAHPALLEWLDRVAQETRAADAR
jgi:glutathione S-transferase